MQSMRPMTPAEHRLVMAELKRSTRDRVKANNRCVDKRAALKAGQERRAYREASLGAKQCMANGDLELAAWAASAAKRHAELAIAYQAQAGLELPKSWQHMV